MTSYRTIARHRLATVSDEDGWQADTAAVIHVDEQEPRFTGLYDSAGQPLYAVEDKSPVGYRLGKR